MAEKNMLIMKHVTKTFNPGTVNEKWKEILQPS